MDTTPTALQEASILIVDDSPAQIMLLKEILLSDGYENLVETSDPRTVLELHKKHNFDLILLDINMPGLSGLDILGQFKEHVDAGHQPKMVAISSQDDQQTQEQALALGAKKFIAKPYQIQDLLSQVRHQVEPCFA